MSGLTNTIRSIASFSLSLGDCDDNRDDSRDDNRGKAFGAKSVAGPTSSDALVMTLVITIAVHMRREASPAGAPDESACGVKLTRRRTTMPSPTCLAGESIWSPECGNTSDCISKQLLIDLAENAELQQAYENGPCETMSRFQLYEEETKAMPDNAPEALKWLSGLDHLKSNGFILAHDYR